MYHLVSFFFFETTAAAVPEPTAHRRRAYQTFSPPLDSGRLPIFFPLGRISGFFGFGGRD